MIAPPMTVLHVVSAREDPAGHDSACALMTGLAGRPDVRQALFAGAGSRPAGEAADRGIDVWTPRWRGRVDGQALAALSARFADAWDVVHAHDGPAVQAALLARALAGGRSRIIAARRDDAAVRHPYAWRHADLVIAASARLREVLIAQQVDRIRIEVIPTDGKGAPGGAISVVEDTLRCYRAVARRSA